jgi:tetratricopeptide (TPR) repeat protein
MINSMPKRWLYVSGIFAAITIACYALLLNPVFQESAGFHLNQWAGQLRVLLNPPAKVAFSNDPQSPADPALVIIPQISKPAAVETISGDSEETDFNFEPLPLSFAIEGGAYFSQHYKWNYCGPANIAMALSYWGWEGTADDAAKVLRTFNKDKNVMPYEMADFVREEAGMGALVRVGGDLDTLKRLIAGGFPVVAEKGPHFRDINYQMTWMGHYQTLTGYNDPGGYFIAQDSYIKPDYHQPYDTFIDEWRSFNFTYLVVYPPEKENDVLNLLSRDADETRNYQNALKKAQDEIYKITGVDQFFAVFNYGTNLVYLRDYSGAAKAYDQAFLMYDALPTDDAIRPYRILWYQTGPYYAYYYTGRYADVIVMTTKNSIEMVRDAVPALEESYYWRGMAKIAIGDQDGGEDDFRTCLEYHRDFNPCVVELNKLGIFP